MASAHPPENGDSADSAVDGLSDEALGGRCFNRALSPTDSTLASDPAITSTHTYHGTRHSLNNNPHHRNSLHTAQQTAILHCQLILVGEMSAIGARRAHVSREFLLI